jgi:hypothetical protein
VIPKWPGILCRLSGEPEAQVIVVKHKAKTEVKCCQYLLLTPHEEHHDRSTVYCASPPTGMPEEIKALFEQVGPGKQVKRPRDQETGEYRKFAFVTMSSPELAATTIEQFNVIEVQGIHPSVKLSEKPSVSDAKPKSKPAVRPPALPEFAWEQRQEILARVLAAPGTATTVKITVVGRSGWIEPRGNTVIIGLTHSLKPTGYPKGVPTPPDTPTTHGAFIGAKQHLIRVI